MAAAERFGTNDSTLDRLLAGIEEASVAAHLKPVRRYDRKLSRVSSKIVPAGAEAGVAAGLPERTRVQAAGACTQFSLMIPPVEGQGRGFTRRARS